MLHGSYYLGHSYDGNQGQYDKKNNNEIDYSYEPLKKANNDSIPKCIQAFP